MRSISSFHNVAFTILLVAFNVVNAFSQNGYNLRFKVDGWSDTVVYLTRYYGETHHINDTAVVDKHGSFHFRGETKLKDRGVYFVSMVSAGKATRQFDILLADDQDFLMTASANDLINSAKIIGDVENELFYRNIKFQVNLRQRAMSAENIIRDSTAPPATKDEAKRTYAKLTDELLAFQDELIAKNPKSLTSKIILAYRPVKIPPPPNNPDGSIDSTFQLRWYREHFFDNFDLSEPGLLCLPDPLYKQKIDEYLDKLFPPIADSVSLAAFRLIERSKSNKQTYRYAVWNTLGKYQQPEIMGLDEVFVSLYDKYVASGEMDFWIDQTTKRNIRNHADRLRKSLVGKLGENLVMQDASLRPQSLASIPNKYTILYIFDPDCGHCREETPKLVSFYNSRKFDVGVYAVCADSSIQKMKSYIKDMKMTWTTVNAHRTYTKWYQDLYDAIALPSIYVLDRQRRIIAKKIPVERLADFLTQYERINDLKSDR